MYDLSLPPFFYEADPTDPMDVALLQELVALNLEVSARLNIKRIRPSEYEIEGERISLYWQTAELCVRARRPRKRGRRSRRRLSGSNDDDDDGHDNSEMLLASYLRQLANVEPRCQQNVDQKATADSFAAAAAFAGVTGGHTGHTWLGGPVLSNAPYPPPPGVPPPQVGPYGASFATNPTVSTRAPMRYAV